MINRLSQVLEKKGPKYVDILLSENVIITEKIDTFRLIFEKKGDELIFYKKDNTPITLIERVLTDIYEEALLEIPIITKEAKIPEGYYFGLYYTPVERPLRIPYSKLPKYILTDITKRDENNKVIESLDYDSIKEWAAVLCMGRPPIIFEGKLNAEQRNLLLSYDLREYDGEMDTFAEMIHNIFNTSYSKENIIEGVIIKSGDRLSQVISYEFDLLNEAYEKANESRDFYDIIISDLLEFLHDYNIPMLEAESKDDLYLNIICNIFNNYCEKRSISEGIDEKYLMPPQFGYNGKLNKKLIANEETLQWINKAPIYEALFKVFVSSFRKTKKPYGLLTEAITNRFNSYVQLINGYINKFDDVKILNEEEQYQGACRCMTMHYIDNEDGTTTCSSCNRTWDHIKHGAQGKKKRRQLSESRSENIVINAVKRRSPNDIDNMRVIASIQKAFEPKIRDVNRGEKPCAVYLTTFEPFTNAQMTNVQRIHDMWNCPVIIMGISNEYKVEGKDFHASDDLMKAQMQSIMNYDNALVPGFALLTSWNITEIFEYCRPEFEPMVIITDQGKKAEMTLQLFLEEEIMGGRINVEDKFNIGELENEDRLSAFRAIEDNNYSLFRELTPPPIHNVMEMVFSEYRLWSGQVLKAIKD